MRDIVAGEEGEDGFDGVFSKLERGLDDGGERGLEEGGELNVVEADDGDVPGDVQSGGKGGTHCAKSDAVVVAEHRCRRRG